MKKALEYAAEFTSAEDKRKAIWEILLALQEETRELIRARSARSNSALFAILNETDDKWRSVVRQTEGVNPKGFAFFISQTHPATYMLWINEFPGRKHDNPKPVPA